MSERESKARPGNVNVTWEARRSECKDLLGRKFPCPVCGLGLDIRLARTQKPYCVCSTCGIQLFVRGKEGIGRLRKIFHAQMLIVGNESRADTAVILYNRIQQLREQKAQLEAKQGLIFRDDDLTHAVRAVDNEIERVQGELEKLSRKATPEKNK